MPVPFALLAQAIPAGLQLAETVVNKPKKDDFKPNTSGMEKFRAYLKGRSSSSEASHLAMQPALRAIGKQNRQIGREVDYAVGRGDLSSSEEAQLRLTQGQQSTEALQEVGEKAMAVQVEENRRIGEQIARVDAEIAAAEEQARLDYERATSQYKDNIKKGVLNLGADVATAGLSDFLTKKATSEAAFDAAKAAGLGGFETAQDLATASQKAGFTDSGQFVNMLQNREKMIEGLAGFDPAEIGKLANSQDFEKAFLESGLLKDGLNKNADIQKNIEAAIRSGDMTRQDYIRFTKALGEKRGEVTRAALGEISAGTMTPQKIGELNVSEDVKNQLTTAYLNQKGASASDITRTISTAITDNDIGTLKNVIVDPNATEAQVKTATNAIINYNNADIKSRAETRKAQAEAAEIPSGDRTKMDNYAAAAGSLKGSIDLVSKDGDKAKALSTYLDGIRDGYGISNEQQDELNTLVKDFVKDLGIGGDGPMTMDVMAFLQSAGLDPKTASEVSLFKWFEGKISNMRRNSIELTPAQIEGMSSIGELD